MSVLTGGNAPQSVIDFKIAAMWVSPAMRGMKVLIEQMREQIQIGMTVIYVIVIILVLAVTHANHKGG